MSLAIAGSVAAAVAVICLVLVPAGARRIAPFRFVHPDRGALSDAGWRHSLLSWEALRAGAVVAGVVLGASAGVWQAGLLAALIPSAGVRSVASGCRERAAREMVAALQLTHAGLRSGASLPEALRLAVADTGELAGRPLAMALRDFDLGAPLDQALGDARDAARDRRVVVALDALALGAAEQLPASRGASVLASVIDRLTFEQRVSDEVRARTSGLRLQVYLLAGLVPCLALYLAITLPGLAQTLGSPLGRLFLVPAAGAFELAGIVASRRVVGELG